MEDSILPLVAKPGQYVSLTLEAGDPVFDDAARRVCLVVPSPSAEAFRRPQPQGLFAALRRVEGTAVDVAFAPQVDMIQALRARDLPWFGMRYRRPLRDYDVIVALPEDPVDLPELLDLLSLGGVEPQVAGRDAAAPWVLLAGALAQTPRLGAHWAELVLPGDPEAFVTDLARWAGALRGASSTDRERMLAEAAGLPGVIARDTDQGAARWFPELPPAPMPPLVPSAPGQTVELGLEISRRSEPGTIRFRDARSILAGADALLATTGHPEIYLTGEDAGRHPDLVRILESLNMRLSPHGVHVRLAEVHLDQFEPALARELLKGAQSRQLTFAPVAPSQSLRRVAGHPLSDDALVEAAGTALRGGWAAIRIQIRVGLAGETAEDRDAWIATLERIQALRPRNGGPRLTVTLVPEGTGSDVEAFAEGIRQRPMARRIKIASRPGAAARARACLVEGTPCPATLLQHLAGRGLHLQSDPEAFDPDVWDKALAHAKAAGGPGPGFPQTLARQAVDSALMGQWVASVFERTSDDDPAPSWSGPPTWMVGRRPRRTGRGRAGRTAERYRVRFSKSEPMRFSAHLDVTRAFDRAFRKVQLPVAMSQGKERKPRVSFGPPLPLGMTSGAEFVDITFAREVPETFTRVLSENLIEGLGVVAAAPIRTEATSLNAAIQLADYEVSFSDVLIHDYLGRLDFDSLKDRLDEAVAGALAADTLEVTRTRGETSKTFNARPSLVRAEVVRDDGGRPVLGFRLTLNSPDSVRPETLTSRLCSWADFDERLLRVHRSGLHIPGRDKVLDPLDVVAPDFAWWNHPVRGGTVH